MLLILDVNSLSCVSKAGFRGQKKLQGKIKKKVWLEIRLHVKQRTEGMDGVPTDAAADEKL